MGRKHRSVPKEAGESGEIRKLKEAVRRLKSDKTKLISEVNTLHAALDKTREYIDGKIDNVPIEKVLKDIKSNKKMKDVAAKDDKKEAMDEATGKIIKYSDKKCKSCQRKMIVLFSSMVRTIIQCNDCNIREVEYEAEKHS